MRRLSDELRISLEAMCGTYQSAITDEARSYLHGRGITDGTIVSYRLGVVAGVPEHQDYQGMISIPYLTSLAGVVGFKFRQPHTCTEHCLHHKYLTPYPSRIFNAKAFDQAERLGYIAICEGEFDAIILDSMCGIPAVAVPGAETWVKHKEWRLLFQGFDRVLVFQDNDADREVMVGGKRVVKNAGKDLTRAILSDVPTAQLVSFAGVPKKDVTEIYLAYGADAIREVANV